MKFIARVKTFVYETDLLRRSVTVPLKALVLSGLAVTIVMVATISAGRLQRAYNSAEAAATAKEVAELRASIDGLRTVCTAKPVGKK
jgi:hypothetical protein